MFPSILLVYMCTTTLLFCKLTVASPLYIGPLSFNFFDFFFLAAGIVIVGFFDNKALFCASKDLIVSVQKENVTPFCTLTGEFN